MLGKAIAGMRRWSFFVEDICSGGEFYNSGDCVLPPASNSVELSFIAVNCTGFR